MTLGIKTNLASWDKIHECILGSPYWHFGFNGFYFESFHRKACIYFSRAWQSQCPWTRVKRGASRLRARTEVLSLVWSSRSRRPVVVDHAQRRGKRGSKIKSRAGCDILCFWLWFIDWERAPPGCGGYMVDSRTPDIGVINCFGGTYS